MGYFSVMSPVGSSLNGERPTRADRGVPLALIRERSWVGMEQGCRALLEPKWHGVHDLLTRLLGRCTCEAGDAHVVELYRPVEAREVDERQAS